MIAGQKVEKTRFIPYILPPGVNAFDSIDFLSISQTLGGKAGIPFFVIFAKNEIELPPNIESIIEKRIISVPDVNDSLECTFNQFKSLICSIYALSFEKRIFPQIGICGACSSDILAYMIIRWLIEEKSVSFDEANQYWINTGLPQLNLDEYVAELRKISAVKAPVQNEPIPQQKSNEEEYDNLIKILEQTNDGQNQNAANSSQVLSQPLSTITSKPLSSYELIVRQLNIKCKTFRKTIPLFSASPLTQTILKQIQKSNDNDDYVVTLEPSGGQRALLFVQNGEKSIICENNQLIVTTDIRFPQSSDLEKEISDTIIEGVFIDTREFRNTFIICDVILYDGIDVSKLRIDARLGYILNDLFPARKEYQKNKIVRENVKLMVRPIFPYSDLRKLIQRIDTMPYPVRAVSIGPIFKPWSDKKDATGWFTWVRDPELPVVVISVNYASSNVVGMVSTPYGMTKVADLGPLSSNLSVIEGSRVHINLDSDMKWKIEGSAEGEEIWTKSKFEENFPNGESFLTEAMILEILNEK